MQLHNLLDGHGGLRGMVFPEMELECSRVFQLFATKPANHFTRDVSRLDVANDIALVFDFIDAFVAGEEPPGSFCVKSAQI